ARYGILHGAAAQGGQTIIDTPCLPPQDARTPHTCKPRSVIMSKANGFKGLLEWRCIGPFRGGRVVAVAGDYHNTNVFYFGACAGGVWKTSDAGTYWENVSDGFFNTAAVGALAIAPSDSNVIYAGTGE